MKQSKPRIKPEFKLADEKLNLRELDNGVIVRQLEESMRMRETPLVDQLRRRARKF